MILFCIESPIGAGVGNCLALDECINLWRTLQQYFCSMLCNCDGKYSRGKCLNGQFNVNHKDLGGEGHASIN